MQAIFVAVTTVACIIIVPETGTPALKRKDVAQDGTGSRRAFVIATCKRALVGPFVWLFTGETTLT